MVSTIFGLISGLFFIIACSSVYMKNKNMKYKHAYRHKLTRYDWMAVISFFLCLITLMLSMLT